MPALPISLLHEIGVLPTQVPAPDKSNVISDFIFCPSIDSHDLDSLLYLRWSLSLSAPVS